jgi:hypothetical protein
MDFYREVLFSIHEVSPSILFREADIEGMREAIRAYDERRAKERG